MPRGYQQSPLTRLINRFVADFKRLMLYIRTDQILVFLAKKYTLKDLALELNISISTVSKALNNSPEISEDTQKKVLALAQLYHYRPNSTALRLRESRSNHIGVVLPDLVHHFFTTVFKGIEEYANARGFNVSVCFSDDNTQKEKDAIDLLLDSGVDGIILSLAGQTQQLAAWSHLQEVAAQGTHLVMFDRVTDHVPGDQVMIDDMHSAYKATQRLIDLGCTRIALLTTESYLSVNQDRQSGYIKALKESNLTYEAQRVLALPKSEVDPASLRTFFAECPVDAVLCVNELIAVQAMHVVTALGKRIPEDVAFVGYNNGMLSMYSYPSLTVVDQQGYLMGEKSAEVLIDKICSKTPLDISKYVIPTTLVERNSTPNTRK
jgi:LacI family transcriptional regulator